MDVKSTTTLGSYICVSGAVSRVIIVVTNVYRIRTINLQYCVNLNTVLNYALIPTPLNIPDIHTDTTKNIPATLPLVNGS